MIGDRGDKGVMSTSYPLTETIIEAIIAEHRTLGPGFLESVYQRALVIELLDRGLTVANEKEVPITYL